MADDVKSRTCVIEGEQVTRMVVLLLVVVESGRVVNAHEDREEVKTFPSEDQVVLRDGAVGFYFVTRTVLKLNLLNGQPVKEFAHDEVGPTHFASDTVMLPHDEMCRRYPEDKQRIGDALELGCDESEMIVRVPLSVSTGKVRDARSFFYIPCQPEDRIRPAVYGGN